MMGCHNQHKQFSLKETVVSPTKLKISVIFSGSLVSGGDFCFYDRFWNLKIPVIYGWYL
jgi:hypothetical protein